MDIENVSISLLNIGSYVCQTPWAKLEKTTQLKISEVIAQGVKAGYTSKIKEQLLVPENASITSVMYCNVFQISYNVQVSIKFRRWNNNVSMNIPIYVGSVGLQPVEQHKSSRIPPLWPPTHHITAIDKENMEKDNADIVDTFVNGKTTEVVDADDDGNTTEEAED